MNITRYLRKKDIEESKIPEINLTKKALIQLFNLIPAKKIEIMLLGYVTHEETSQKYTIDEFVIPPQTDNTGAFVTTHDTEYPKWLYTLSREERLRLKCHLHTHPGMSVSPSSVDDNMIKDKVENIDDFYIRVIINQKFETKVDLFDIKNKLLYEDLPLFAAIGEEKDYTINYTFSKKGISTRANAHEKLLKDLDSKIIVKETEPVNTVTVSEGAAETYREYFTEKKKPKTQKDYLNLFDYYDPEERETTLVDILIANRNKHDNVKTKEALEKYIENRYNIPLNAGIATVSIYAEIQNELECIIYEDSPKITLAELETTYIAHLTKMVQHLDLGIKMPKSKHMKETMTLGEWYYDQFK